MSIKDANKAKIRTVNLKFRPITESDKIFLFKLYCTTRENELSLTDWSAEQKDVFLQQQFNAQHKYYHEYFPHASFLIILDNEKPIGRIYTDRRIDEIRLIDITLLPEYRGKGIGTLLLKDLQSEAEEAGKPLRIHVEKFNPALHLYERLGFTRISDSVVYYLMEWPPKTN